MLPNLEGGNRSCEISVFGHDSLPPRDIMGGITNNDGLKLIHGLMFRDVGSCHPVICIDGEWAIKLIEFWNTCFHAGGLGMHGRLMLPNRGGSRCCEINGFGLTLSSTRQYGRNYQQ